MTDTTLWRLESGPQSFEAITTAAGVMISRCGPHPAFEHEHDTPGSAISSAILYARFHTGNPSLGDEGFPPGDALFWDLRQVERHGGAWDRERAEASMNGLDDCLAVDAFPSDDEIFDAHRSLRWLEDQQAIARRDDLHQHLRESYSEMMLPSKDTLAEIHQLLSSGLQALQAPALYRS